jgi:hypothetical protein
MLSDEDRKRHEHLTENGKIMGFVVQYETLLNDKWMPVVRYDTAHGYAHKDLINPDGRKEKILIGVSELTEALTFADKDIIENWARYKDRFMRRIRT